MSLFRSGILIALFTLLSRIFGLIRELFIAALFGTSYVADSINLAFKLPNLFRRIFAEGAMQAVFVPMFNEKLSISNQAAKIFSNQIYSVLIISLILLTIIMQIYMDKAMLILAPGFMADAQKYALTIELCRITMPYIIFISIVALFGGVLNSLGDFISFAASPIIMNIAIILVTYILKDATGSAHAIAYAIIVAGIVQLLVIKYALYKNNMMILPKKIIIDDDLKYFFKQMLPATLSSGVMQLNLFISQSIASFSPGAVSIIGYAERLYQFPLSIIGVAFGTVLLPSLAKLYKAKHQQEASILQNEAIKLALLLSLPCSVGIISLAPEIIHIIYERGAFLHTDTLNTAKVLSWFTTALPAFILAKIYTPIFYANNDTKTPFKITLYSLSMNILLNIILMYYIGYVGIAIGSAIAAWFNLALLIKYARIYNINNNQVDRNFIVKIIFASFIMWLVICFTSAKLSAFIFQGGLLVKVTLLMTIICLAILIYLTLIILTKAINLSQIVNSLKKK